MSDKLFIPIILGTVREGRQSEKVASWLFTIMNGLPYVETKLVDIRDLVLPMDDEGKNLKERNPEYLDVITAADGIIIVVPEYNHGYPGSLKRALDILYAEYKHKAVGLCGVSSGQFSGVRAIEQLSSVVRTMGLIVSPVDLLIPKVEEFFDKEGIPVDEASNGRAGEFIDEVFWLSSALNNKISQDKNLIKSNDS